MKKISISLVLILLFSLLITGCNKTTEQASNETTSAVTPSNDQPATESVSIPSFAELLEINDLENIFKTHANVYVSITSKSPSYNYTEEVIYVKDDSGLCYHKISKQDGATSYSYISRVGNAFYYIDDSETVSMLTEGDDAFFDYTLEFDSTPVGKGYIENSQIVYHTYCIFEADEMFDFPASRSDYTLYFNKDTKLIERMDYVSYDTEHQVETRYSSTISYDVENVEEKYASAAYATIMGSDDLINLEIIASYGTPEQTSYHFVTTTDSQVYAAFNDVTYLLYADPDCQSLVLTLDAYKGVESLTLYAKIME